MDVNLPHALATLTRDVLQNYKPVWWGHCDLGSYRLEGEPLYGVDQGPLVTLRFIHQQEERRKAFERYMRKMEDIAFLYGGKAMSLEEVTLMYPDEVASGDWRPRIWMPERLRGPRGPDPFSVTLPREELLKLYPNKE